MPEIRYYEERPCEHGEEGLHPMGQWVMEETPKGDERMRRPMCPGGSRREITVDYEAAHRTLKPYFAPDMEGWSGGWQEWATHKAVDAALGRRDTDE